MKEFYPYRYKGYPAGLESRWTFPMPSEKERDKRWEAVRRSMIRHNVDCLIVGAPRSYMPMSTHLHYVSNFFPYFNNGTYVVFPVEGNPQLVVNNVLGPQFEHCASETSWIKDIAASLNPTQFIIRKIKELKLDEGKIGIIGYKLAIFPASVYDALRENLPDASFEDDTHVLNEAMNEVSRTSEEEKTFLKRGCEILDQCYQVLAENIRPGVKECDLWAVAEQTIIRNGGWYAHNMYATSGPSPTFPRAPASHNTLNSGDIVMFEISIIYGGVFPQACFALSIGQPNSGAVEMFEFCKDLYHFSLAALEEQRTFIDIETEIINRMHSRGYGPMTPQIHRYNMAIAMPMECLPQPGDYFTVHPNVCNLDYTGGAKLGDTVHITKDGKVKRLQVMPIELIMV